MHRPASFAFRFLSPLRGLLFGAASVAATASARAAPPAVCTAPSGQASIAGALVVGNGTPASCTAAALQAAINAASVITFTCGAAPATIPVYPALDVPSPRATV